MARGKVQMRRIENPVHRQVTFCKRRAGIFKKAKELSVLCDAEIGLFIFSANGKLFEFATKGNLQELINRYMKSTIIGDSPIHQETEFATTHVRTSKPIQIDTMELEINMLRKEVESLRQILRFMFGGGNGGTRSLDELHQLEKHLEILMYNIRSSKMDVMYQEIEFLKNKEGVLKAANNYLQEKMEKHIEVMTDDFVALEADIQYPIF